MKFNESFGLFQRKLPVDLGTTMFEQMLFDGSVIDGRAGGLIIGRKFSEGGVPIVFQRGREFMIHSFTEHGEFILNRVAATRNLSRIKAINAGLSGDEDTPEPRVIPEVSRLILTAAEPCDKFLWLNWSQMAIAAQYVDRHVAELNEMNDETNPYGFCDVETYFPRLDLGTEDGIV
ncbi:MAG: hypothetical protein ABIZ81_09560 [Opitutaceae bacterium]